MDFSTSLFPDKDFFDLLPLDWKESITPYWKDYKNSSEIYTLSENNKLIGGGIVFTKTTPDMMYSKDYSDAWFKKGYAYIGFLWINENYRGQQLGSKWLDLLFKKNPNQKFWLSVEDHGLVDFYKRNNFILVDEHFHEQKEWILTYG